MVMLNSKVLSSQVSVLLAVLSESCYTRASTWTGLVWTNLAKSTCKYI